MPSNPVSRPLIGVATHLGESGVFCLHRACAEAVEAAGGLPVLIPLIPRRSYLESLVSRLDAIVLAGSVSDLDPDYYGEEPSPRLGNVTPERDRTDMLLLDILEESAKPLLGIGFGLQTLNVSRGGSLIQDISTQVRDPIKHDQGRLTEHPAHYVALEPGSLLAELAHGTTVRVNSCHHQAVGLVGADLRVAARSSDGVIEALEDVRPSRFVLGLQWRPEIGYLDDPFAQSIFRRLTEAALAVREIDDVAGI